MQAPDQIADLLFKYLRNELSPEEKFRLESWRKDSPKNEEIFRKYTDPEQLTEFLKDLDSRENAWNKIVNLAPELELKSADRNIRWRSLSIAAAVFLIIGLTLFMRAMRKPVSMGDKDTSPETAKNESEDSAAKFSAVSNKAVLTLSNGKQVLLDSILKPDIDTLGNNIRELSAGQLSYSDKEENSGKDTETFNTLTTPRGGQFELTLQDGTRVWLNAASMIKYPIAFAGKQRKVEIQGEVYFEVAKDTKKPFIVGFGNDQVEVLGTHFDINSYSDEPKVSVALLEGLVRFQTTKGSKILKPGELAQVSNASGDQNINLIPDADLNAATSWRTGRTLFKDADIQSIMRIVSRWYNVDVAYQGNISKRLITGGISKNESLSELLKVLEWNKIHYSISGNQITIKP